MSTAKAKVGGHPPQVVVAPTEKAKYEAMWGYQEYRKVSPGEDAWLLFKQIVRPAKGSTLIDFGCGTGRGGQALAALCGLKVTLLDFASNCLDAEVAATIKEFPDKLSFVEHDLTKPMSVEARYGYCTDVMEHIPPEQVDLVLSNILGSSKSCFFQIATVDDNLGVLIGHPLHLTVKPYEWWKQKFEEKECFIRWSKDFGNHCVFYVSRFARPKDFLHRLSLNVTQEQRRANITENLKLGLPEATPHETNDIEVMILAGGPSLNDFEEDIKAKRAAGMPLITVNGTYHWALDRGMKPSAQIMADSREHNKRFVIPPVDTCRYLLASTCHPEAVKAAPKDQTILWHAGDSDDIKPILEQTPGDHFPVYGGSTIMLRAIPLMRMLGYRKFHIYGWDSCLRGDEHHAYGQPENGEDDLADITVGNRTFKCRLWMACQAEEFITITKMIADECELEVYGDGLIAEIIKTSAERAEEN